ncbi:cupredoxin domain-containing protein [Methanoregula sp.]|uniref:cupredoxin domain-containing protein n=1 Tax=Methanoregula sp. TaxID=2052170 RepID=UPI003C73F0FA
MKKVIGLLILILVLVAVSGCTQQAKPAPVTTTVPTTVVSTVAATTVATTVETTAAPMDNSTAAVTPATNATAENVTTPEETSEVPTVTQAVTMSMTPSTAVTVVHIVNNTFSPAVLMVLPGTGITWKNDDQTIHSVKTIGDNAGMFNSGAIVNGGTFIYTFSESEGTYQYADGYNMNVTGTIIVQKGDTLVGRPTMVAMSEPTNST